MSRESSGPVVTVAELMRRCAPAPDGDDDTAEPIPVGSLLRREGRGRRDFDRPDVPAATPTKALLVRRGAIAAGALLAAGSVVALTTAMDANRGLPSVTGTYPDQGAPDEVAADAPATGLDAGTAAPTSWLPVAFPTAFSGSEVQRVAAAAPISTTAARPSSATGAAPSSTAAPASTTKSRTSTPTTTTRSRTVVGDTTKALGDTVDEVGAGTPVVGGLTHVVGSTVKSLGRTVDNTVAPITSSVLPTSSTTPTSEPTASSSTTTPTSSTSSAVTSTVDDVVGLLS